MRLLIGIPDTRRLRPNGTRSRSRAPDSALIGFSTPRVRDGNFDRTVDLTTVVDAAGTQLSAGLSRASLRATIQSLSRSRARASFGARKYFLTRRSRAEEIEPNEDSSPPLNAAS